MQWPVCVCARAGGKKLRHLAFLVDAETWDLRALNKMHLCYAALGRIAQARELRASVRVRAHCYATSSSFALLSLAPILRMVFAKSFFTAAAGRGYHRRAKLENFLSGRTKKRT